MKDDRGLKRTLDELKRQIGGLSYYLQHIRPKDKDRNSATNLNHARSTLQSIEHTMKTKLEPFEKEIAANIQNDKDDRYVTSLASINSPDKKMIKNAEDLMDVKTSVVGKGDILKDARERMLKNIKSSISNLKKRAQNANKTTVTRIHKKEAPGANVNTRRGH